ncbi:MAG TPA: glycoside hydrolase domain-containing protein [Planctomycetota bacterium]|nr:glycoside hydrolase domain-containing protein [Planctomycetota bacterium]
MRRLRTLRFVGCLVGICLMLSSGAGAQEATSFLLSSFEPGGPAWVKTSGQVVTEHATDGRHAVMLESNPTGYPNLVVEDGAALRRFRDYVLLKVDVFNPQGMPVKFGVRVDDAKSNSYGTRYNDDGMVAAPGRSTLELNLTGLTRSMARNFLERDKLDLAQLRLAMVFLHPRKDTVRLYFDNVRLEGSGLPTVEGLRAFDFGPAKSAVYPGFEQVHEGMRWDEARGFGWVNPVSFRRLFTPDDLGSDFGRGDEFRVKLPDGAYEVNLQIDVYGEWHSLYHYRWRELLLNGERVFREDLTPKEFMEKRYYAHEDAEDLPGEDVWEKFVTPVNRIRRHTVRVTDGLLRVALKSDNPMGQTITFLVVYPESQAAAGRKWMDTLDKVRRERFKNAMAVGLPPTPAAMGYMVGNQPRFLLFTRHTSLDIPVNAVPTREEQELTLHIQAAQGEREHLQLGLYPAGDVKGLRVTVSDFENDRGDTVPASAVKVRKVRNFLKRIGPSAEGRILPYLLQDFDTLDLARGLRRAIWLTVTVPKNAQPGEYAGTIRIMPAEGEKDPVQRRQSTTSIRLTVFPFKLERARSITLSATGTTAGHWRGWFPELEDDWWETAEVVMKDLADHGMNAVTGGPGARLKGVTDGKADIDYADMDRWLALAVKHGLTHPGDSYQGLAIRGVPQDQSRDCMRINEQTSRRQFGVGYEELIRIVYADVARHAKEKGWPPRVYYLLDEPRPDYGNVGPAIELTKLYAKAAPGTLFSGYYSLGGGREPLFETMPVSIAHFKAQAAELTTKAGKQLWDYDGNRVRHNIGRWAFKASKAGLKGYLRNGYMYVNCNPYFDFSEDEGSWACVYPSRHGLNATVGWERTGQGANDFAYMEMLDQLIGRARAAGRAKAQADAAETYLKTSLAKIDLDDRNSATLTPDEWDTFKRTLAGHIVALRKALGE